MAARMSRPQFPSRQNPLGIVREPVSYWDICSAGPCGHSVLPPYELGQRLARSVGHGKILTGFDPVRRRMTPLCTVTVFGGFHGYTTFAIAYRHVIYTPTLRRAPRGAIDYRHRGRIFMLGSDVSIGMSQPNAKRACVCTASRPPDGWVVAAGGAWSESARVADGTRSASRRPRPDGARELRAYGANVVVPASLVASAAADASLR